MNSGPSKLVVQKPSMSHKNQQHAMNLGTLNIRGNITKKLDGIISEIKKMEMDIVVLTETRKKNNGIEEIDEYIHFYNGNDDKSIKGVSILLHKKHKENIKDHQMLLDRFMILELNIEDHQIFVIGVYAPCNSATIEERNEYDLNFVKILSEFGDNAEIIIMGDLNARTGMKENDVVVGRYGEEKVNTNGRRLITLCTKYKLKIMNGYFQNRDNKQYTCTRNGYPSIIDYVILKQQTKLNVIDFQVLDYVCLDTDHRFVKAKVEFKSMPPTEEKE